MRPALTCALSAALLAASVAAGARADTPVASGNVEEAQKHFEAGSRAYSAGDYTRAGQEFEAANAAQAHADSLYNAARSWEHAGDAPRAADFYRAYLRVAGSSDPDRSRGEAALAALGARVGRLSLVLRDVTGVTLDGKSIPAFDANDPFAYVTPGEHVVAASADTDSVSRVVHVSAGETVSVVLQKPAIANPEPPKPDPPKPDAQPHSLPLKPIENPPNPDAPKPVVPPEHHGAPLWVPIGLGGLTAVSASLMIASGIDVLKAKDDYDTLKSDATPSEQQDLIDEGVYRTDRTNVLIGVTGALALGTGIALIFTDFGPRAPKVQAGPSGVRVVGTF